MESTVTRIWTVVGAVAVLRVVVGLGYGTGQPLDTLGTIAAAALVALAFGSVRGAVASDLDS